MACPGHTSALARSARQVDWATRLGARLAVVGLNRSFLGSDVVVMHSFGQLAVRACVATATDLVATLGEIGLESLAVDL